MPDDPSPADRSPVDADDLDLGWSLGVLLRAYLKAGDAAFEDLPGGPRGYQVLAGVERRPPSSQLALATRLGVDRTVMTYLIDDLVEAGLVRRRTNPEDRRSKRLELTDRARGLLPALDARLARLEEALLSALDEPERRRLRTLLRRAAREIDRNDPLEDFRDIARGLG